MPIKGISDQARMTRIGKIKIGEKDEKGRPKKLDYFRLDCDSEEIQKAYNFAYGDKPHSLPVMFFSDDLEETFPHYLQYWTGGILWCRGDGETATRRSENPGQRVAPNTPPMQVQCGQSCPHYGGKNCKPYGTLRFLLPELPTICYFEIRVAESSISPILNTLKAIYRINGSLRWATAALEMRPFKSSDGYTVYGLRLDVKKSILELVSERPKALAPPGDEPLAIEPPDEDEVEGEPVEEQAAPSSGGQNPNIPDTHRQALKELIAHPLMADEREGFIACARDVKSKEDADAFLVDVSKELIARFNASGNESSFVDDAVIMLSDTDLYNEDERDVLIARVMLVHDKPDHAKALIEGYKKSLAEKVQGVIDEPV